MKNLMCTLFKMPIVMVALLALSPVTSWADQFYVIVNVENRYEATKEDAVREVSRLYLKKKKSWPSGLRVKALGRKPSSLEHKAFLSSVLQMSEPDLVQHWLSMKQKTGQTPPRAISSDRATLKMVAKSIGAFGIIGEKAKAKLPSNIRILLSL